MTMMNSLSILHRVDKIHVHGLSIFKLKFHITLSTEFVLQLNSSFFNLFIETLCYFLNNVKTTTM